LSIANLTFPFNVKEEAITSFVQYYASLWDTHYDYRFHINMVV